MPSLHQLKINYPPKRNQCLQFCKKTIRHWTQWSTVLEMRISAYWNVFSSQKSSTKCIHKKTFSGVSHSPVRSRDAPLKSFCWQFQRQEQFLGRAGLGTASTCGCCCWGCSCWRTSWPPHCWGTRSSARGSASCTRCSPPSPPWSPAASTKAHFEHFEIDRNSPFSH